MQRNVKNNLSDKMSIITYVTAKYRNGQKQNIFITRDRKVSLWKFKIILRTDKTYVKFNSKQNLLLK